MKVRHRYLIARAAAFATLLVFAAGTAVSVGNGAGQTRPQSASSATPATSPLAMSGAVQRQEERRL